jgi:hypothetical protein
VASKVVNGRQIPMVYPVGEGTGGSAVVQGNSGSPLITFTRPNDTNNYTAGDVIGDGVSGSANLELPNAGNIGSLMQILSASVTINRTSLPTGMTSLRLHLWESAPAAIADNAPFAAASADRAKYRGSIPLSTPTVIGGGFLFTFADYTGRPFRLTSTSLWANLVTDTAVTSVAALTEYIVRLSLAEVGG